MEIKKCKSEEKQKKKDFVFIHQNLIFKAQTFKFYTIHLEDE